VAARRHEECKRINNREGNVLKKSLQLWGALAGFAAFSATVSAQQAAPPTNEPDPRTMPQERKGSAENSLIGVSLYDTGLKIVTKFGTPDDVQAISVGGGGTAGGGAPGGGGAGTGSVGAPVGASRGGGGGGGRGGAGTATPPPSLFNIPVDDHDPLPGFVGDPFLMRGQLPPPEGSSNAGGGGPAPSAGGRGGGAGAPTPGAGGGGGGGGSADRVTVTRWTYNMGAKRYAFILDKFNRVVQIEAIGLPNKAVKTHRGATLGSQFSTLIKLYGAPDGYEISGNTIVVRYLVFDRVAFRLQRLKADAPHQVTGIVVAAGKT
jgi:hypothetical protein